MTTLEVILCFVLLVFLLLWADAMFEARYQRRRATDYFHLYDREWREKQTLLAARDAEE